jgi:hypothetical protein
MTPDVDGEEDRPMIVIEQAVETPIVEQDEHMLGSVSLVSRVGEDMDIDYWTLLEESRIVG